MDKTAGGHQEEKLTPEKSEIITAEFRHEVVLNFVRDLSRRVIRLKHPSEHLIKKSKMNRDLADMHVKLTSDITEYCSDKIHGQELNELELILFDTITFYNATGLIVDRISESDINSKLQKIEENQESTNMLLKRLIDILDSIAEAGNEK